MSLILSWRFYFTLHFLRLSTVENDMFDLNKSNLSSVALTSYETNENHVADLIVSVD